MQSIENKILNNIKKCGRGNAIFSSDFVRFGEQKTVNKALERLAKEGVLIRISRGFYYYPKIDRKLGLGVLYPTLETIAESIAKRDKARIVPTGLYALNRLGFSTQIPMNIQYLTDGSNRKLTLYNGATIEFKHTAPKNLAFNSQLAMLITFAFRSLGKENITEEILAHTKELLAKDKSQTVKQDYKLMPAWVSSIIKSLYEK
ncbi:MAG: type IV toxin-antitoxin system AbiEi family antitoxin domain-containing protein [Bacteroidales bacterium]|nr:type IV toxin-antitoxin system AbiEi family antitoxin domain-containing protein [Bacteroidales bacterium]